MTIRALSLRPKGSVVEWNLPLRRPYQIVNLRKHLLWTGIDQFPIGTFGAAPVPENGKRSGTMG